MTTNYDLLQYRDTLSDIHALVLLSTHSESIADFEDMLVLLAMSLGVIEALTSPAIMSVPC